MGLIRIDPYEDLYQFSGMDYEMKPVKRSDVEAIDYLLKVSGIREDVKTIDDWGVVAKLIEFYSRRWPEEWADYVVQVKEIRESRARKDGYSREKGKEGTRYLAVLPGGHFPKLFKIIFPNQQWDREFTSKFMENIKITRVGEKIDTWFTFPNAPTRRRDIIQEEISKLKADGNSNTKPSSSGTRLVRNKKRRTG